MEVLASLQIPWVIKGKSGTAQLYIYKFDNLDETDPFLERHNLQNSCKKEISNRPLSIKEIESIIINSK